MTVYESCFVGIEAVDWFLAAGVCHKREVAVALGQKLLEAHFFHHVVRAVWRGGRTSSLSPLFWSHVACTG